jgi:hypothetical protein
LSDADERERQLELQLQRLAAGEMFDFEGGDIPEYFRRESPTITYLANVSIDCALRRGASEVHVLPHKGAWRLDVVFLVDGVRTETEGRLTAAAAFRERARFFTSCLVKIKYSTYPDRLGTAG